MYGVLSAGLFVTLNDRLHMAGEWIIGGVEAKGFAYVLVLLGLESLVRDSLGRATLSFGAASAFHVIVGGWAVIAAAWSGWQVATGRRWPPGASAWPEDCCWRCRDYGRRLRSLAESPPIWCAEANRIYVFERLYHHLLPQGFPPLFVVRHLLLIAALVGLVYLLRKVASSSGCGRLSPPRSESRRLAC